MDPRPSPARTRGHGPNGRVAIRPECVDPLGLTPRIVLADEVCETLAGSGDVTPPEANVLDNGDNLDVLRRYVRDEWVDLVYLRDHLNPGLSSEARHVIVIVPTIPDFAWAPIEQ